MTFFGASTRAGASIILGLTLFSAVGFAQTLIQGTVTDQNTGNPIAGATVSVSGGTPVLTDVNGAYAIPAQQGISETGDLTVVETGYFKANPSYNLSGGTPATVNISMLYGGTLIQGVVTDANTHAPLSASVQLYLNAPGGSGSPVATGPNGSYAIDASSFYVWSGVSGGFTVDEDVVSAPGYLTLEQGDNTVVNSPFPGVENFQLIPSTGTLIQGTVTDQNTGNPIAGATVSVSGGTPVLTDVNGAYAIPAQQGISETGDLTVVETGYFKANPSYNLSGGTPATANISMLYGGTLIQGVVTDANTHAPLSASVQLYLNAPGGSGSPVATGPNGSYAIDASSFYVWSGVSGGFTVDEDVVSAPGYLTLEQGDNTVVNPPFPGVENFQLIPSTGTLIQGTVTDQNTGNPIAGATVSVSGGTPVLTDVNGAYAIPAQQGISETGDLTVVETGYFKANPSYNLSGGTPATVNISLLYGGTLIQGVVTDANTHAPLSASVQLYLNAPGGSGSPVATGPNGSYAIDASSFYVWSGVSGGFTVDEDVVSAPGYLTLVQGDNTIVNPPFPGVENFQLIPNGVTQQITITTEPPALNIIVDGTQYTAPQTFTWVPSNFHTLTTTSPQTVVAQTGTSYSFTRWNDRGALSHAIVAPSSNTAFTAVFATQYLLTTNASPAQGGTVTAGGWINADSNVQIQATPNSGYQFSGFSGSLSGATNPQLLTVNAPETVTANFETVPTPQTITFGALSDRAFGPAPFTVSATATSGLGIRFGSLTKPVCTVSGTTVKLVAVGTCTLQATQAGNAKYAAAPPVDQTFQVTEGSEIITFDALSNLAFGTAPFIVSATASSGLIVHFGSQTKTACTVSGTTVKLVAVGTCTLQATQAGNAKYAAATPVNQSFQVTQASQIITFAALPSQVLGTAPFTVGATASSKLGVRLGSQTKQVCTVSGTTVKLVAAGTCTIQATQAGNANYAAATPVDQSFQVTR